MVAKKVVKMAGRVVCEVNKVILDKSRGEVSLLEKDTIENVS